jgi:hypothetical protein
MRHTGWACGLIVACALIAPTTVGAQQAVTCLYGSRAYSEGAFICVQRSLMLSCSSEGARLAWKVVADKDLSDRCLVPTTVTAYAPAPRVQSRRVQRSRPRPVAAASVGAKCFTFNGKRYCE